MRFYVTSKLRAHDAGLLQIGLEYTDKMAIPPHQKLFTLTGYCVPQCTRVVRADRFLFGCTQYLLCFVLVSPPTDGESQMDTIKNTIFYPYIFVYLYTCVLLISV